MTKTERILERFSDLRVATQIAFFSMNSKSFKENLVKFRNGHSCLIVFDTSKGGFISFTPPFSNLSELGARKEKQ